MGITFIYPKFLWLLLLIPMMFGISLFSTQGRSRDRLWPSLILRGFISLALILALAGLQLQLITDSLTTVFLLDSSDSIPVEQQEHGEAMIKNAIKTMPKGDKAAVVVFGGDALVERLATEETTLSDLESIPIRTQTDISSALQLAIALFPNEGAKRVVLLSDGQETIGYAIDQANLLALSQIELLIFPLNNEIQGVDVWIDRLEVPFSIRKGEQINLTAIISSTDSIRADLRIIGDQGFTFSQETLNLTQGENRFTFPVESLEAGFHRFNATINLESGIDYRPQNNQASAFVNVAGPPNILILEGTAGEGQSLANALISAEMVVTVSSPTTMPVSLLDANRFDAIIFVNIPSSALPIGSMEIVKSYVRDLGKGFIMIGGDNSYGAGGYLRTAIEEALPVNMDVRSKDLTANLALILAIDKSGSMGRCHCDDPDLNQQYTRQEVGQPKVDIAKEAVMKAASALGPEDYLGVVAFDETAKWALDVGKLASNISIERAIGGIIAEGQTNILAGVDTAYSSLNSIDAKRKHIILLTDGWTHSGDLTPLVEEMASNGITLSIIAAGAGSAEYLEALSIAGNGEYYPAQDILRVPDIFLRETVRSAGRYIIEEPFLPLPEAPGPTLIGIDTLTLPAILGYNGTTPKTAARLDLITPSGDPLLATWQYGLGRSAAWTSDMKSQWAQLWVDWSGFAKFSAQLIGWVLPEPKSDFIEAKTTMVDNRAVIDLVAIDEFGQPQNFVQASATIVDPELNSTEIQLVQVGPGEYQGSFEVIEPGSYLIRVGANDETLHSLGQQTLGLIVPYSPEYKNEGIDLATLYELARITGGSELRTPQDAFVHNLPTSTFALEIWRPLLLITALLFPLDVAVRRLVFNNHDLKLLFSRIQELTKTKPKEKSQEPKLLGPLFRARDRARSRQSLEIDGEEGPGKELESLKGLSLPDEKTLAAPEGAKDEEDQTVDTLARLREAKKRTQKRD